MFSPINWNNWEKEDNVELFVGHKIEWQLNEAERRISF